MENEVMTAKEITMQLYPFQRDALRQIKSEHDKGNQVCLAWYTGSGKTNIFAQYCKDLLRKNPNAKIGISAYLTTEIREQVVERLGQFGIHDMTSEVSSYAPIKKSANIFVFNPQGLYRKDKIECIFDLLIIDEGHIGLEDGCKMLKKIMDRNCNINTKILLVTATPWDVIADERYKGITLLKRPLDKGIEDGLITDFKFIAEECDIEFKPDDFNKRHELKMSSSQAQMSLLRSICIGKIQHLINNYDDELGKKVLVICPPGNYAEVARELAKQFDGLAYIATQGFKGSKLSIDQWEDTRENLEIFKNSKCRFLFVVNKCSVGFDMKDLTSVIDLSMSRNIKVLAQRFGRIARKNGNQKKYYFYAYDKSLMKNKLSWLLCTAIDFCMGEYEGWTTRSAYRRPVSVVTSWENRQPYAVNFREAVRRTRENMHNTATVKFVTTGSQTVRRYTLEIATEMAKKYSSRTEMWAKQPALYKWFRLNAKAEMDLIFPMKHRLGYWNEERVIASIKAGHYKSRRDWARKYSGAASWVRQNNRQDLYNLLPSPNYQIWTNDRAIHALSNLRKWNDLRHRSSGLRYWFQKNGGEGHWRKKWMDMHGINPKQAKELVATKESVKKAIKKIKAKKIIPKTIPEKYPLKETYRGSIKKRYAAIKSKVMSK